MLELIERKRDGRPLESQHWGTLAAALLDRRVPAYQLAAFNVAVSIRGLSAGERAHLVGVFAVEGETPDLLELPDIGIDRALYGGMPPKSTRPSHALLRKKIAGEALTDEEIGTFIRGVTDLSVRDDEIAAFCMAVYLRGMNRAEVVSLTRAMLRSGEVLEWHGLPGPVVDKHSTGGVGDKVSLPLIAVLCACGAYVPMISGRGLGHTGGTLDKMQSIPGYRIDLSPAEIQDRVTRVGGVITGQTANLAPADRRLYAIRDVTGSVSSIPLITASILSKKLAEGISSLVLDVKVGSGGFMKTLPDAQALAQSLAEVGRAAGVKVSALLTSMNEPIGLAVGNALEVAESVACLRGEGPADLEALVAMLGAELLVSEGLAVDHAAGEARIRASMQDGTALARFREMVAAQGGDPAYVDDPRRFPSTSRRKTIVAPGSGYVEALDAELIGRALVALGGGRRVQEDVVDPAVGVILKRKVGARVAEGEPILELHANHDGRLQEAEALVLAGLRVGPTAPAAEPLLLDRK